MTDRIAKRSISIAGHHTSITLESIFWDSLKTLAKERNQTMQELIRLIDAKRGEQNLSSAIRVFVLKAYIAKLTFSRDPSTEEASRLPES